MRSGRWKLHLSVVVVAIAAMTLALTPAIADPLSDTDEYPDVAFLARNDVPFDAQTAASIAAQLGAPMFITNPNTLSDAAADGIADLNPDVLIVAGGSVAVSAAVADEAAAQCDPSCTIDRRFGTGRDQTAAALATIASDYGFDRPVLQGSKQVVGDVNVGGKVNADAITAQDTGLVSGLNADRLDGMHADAFLGVNEKAKDADAVDGINSDDLQVPDTAPPGRTMKGGFYLDTEGDGSGTHGLEIDFPFPLATAPTDMHFIFAGATPPAECPGDASNPTAQAGHLCIYESSGFGYSVNQAGSFDLTADTDRFGAIVRFSDDTNAGDLHSIGRWAVTAPE